jgi:multiple antibiotic resistance protein
MGLAAICRHHLTTLGLINTLEPTSPRILLIASLAVRCLFILAALWGQPILAFINVGLDDFRIAGGLLAMVIAFECSRRATVFFFRRLEARAGRCGYPWHCHHAARLSQTGGPAKMSVIITLSNDTTTLWGKGMLVAAVVLTTALTALNLYLAKPLSRMLGTTGLMLLHG